MPPESSLAPSAVKAWYALGQQRLGPAELTHQACIVETTAEEAIPWERSADWPSLWTRTRWAIVIGSGLQQPA